MSAYWFYMGVAKYGLWFDGGPGGGFMPVFSSVFAALFALFLLKRGDAVSSIPYSAYIPVGMVILAVGLTWIIGMLPALAVVLFLWFWQLEQFSLSRSALLTVIPMAVVVAIFRVWLRVPFPTGIFG
jgi:hypothetical protein